jgi:hypothetical protein
LPYTFTGAVPIFKFGLPFKSAFKITAEGISTRGNPSVDMINSHMLVRFYVNRSVGGAIQYGYVPSMGHAIDTNFAVPSISIAGTTLNLQYTQHPTVPCAVSFKWTVNGIVL